MLMTADKSTVGTRHYGVVCRNPVVQLDAVETLREVFPGAAINMFHGLDPSEANLDALGSCGVLVVIGPDLEFHDSTLPRRLAEQKAAVVLVDVDPADLEKFGVRPVVVEQPFTSETLISALRAL